MFLYKWIKLNDSEKIKMEIYGTIREIYLITNEINEYIGMLDLKNKNDKLIYNDLLKIRDNNSFNEFLKKYNWNGEK